MRSVLAKILLAMVTIGAWPATALADEVANPGKVTMYLVGNKIQDWGSMLYIRREPYRLFLTEPASLSGTIDADGNLFVSTKGMYFPPVAGPLFFQFAPTVDLYGRILPRTGEANLTLSIETRFSGEGVPPECRIPAVDVFASTEYGVPYSSKDGSAVLVDFQLAIPVTVDCGFWGGTIDFFLGLPSPAGENGLVLVAATDPVLRPG